jgi:LuxR family transcriptional regulator, positive regulator of biofilm formation
MYRLPDDASLPNLVTVIAQRLSARPSEARVGLLVMQGFGNKEIARKLNISESTVKAHVSSLLRLSNVHNRVQLTNLLFHLMPGLNRNMQLSLVPAHNVL